MINLSSKDIGAFERDGFLIIENVLTRDQVSAARARFQPLFAGEFETGLAPDEWNWRNGVDSETLTRQICNAWKSDRTVASIVLSRDIGQVCAKLRSWPGARINQDNIIWKPAGSAALGFHQDDSYQAWITPNEMMTFWMTLDDTRAQQGTIEYVPGSHHWPLSPPITQFHAPDDPLVDMKIAAKHAGVEPQVIPIEVPAGSAVIHHGRTWHGSRANAGTQPRRSLVAHCASSQAKFHNKNISPIYSRYKRSGSLEMDESFFPILWHENGHRTKWLDSYITGSI